MRFAIYLGFDKKTENAIKDLRLALFEGVRHMPHPKKMPPHLSLFVFDSDDIDDVLGRFKAIADGMTRFDIKLGRIGAFRSRRSVLFLTPQITKSLKEAHRRAIEVYSGVDPAPAYQNPEDWKPHVTLATGLAPRTFCDAEKLAEKVWKSATAGIRLLGLINVQKPLEILASKNL